MELGLTLRVAGLLATPFCAKLVPPVPSSQVRFHGPVPVSAAWIVVVWFEQIAASPLTVAVGKQEFTAVALLRGFGVPVAKSFELSSVS